jgi:hypothetical protein
MGKAARAFGDDHRFAGNLFAAGVLPAIDSPRLTCDFGQRKIEKNTDRRRLLDPIGEMSEEFAVDIFAYILMSYHNVQVQDRCHF